MATGHSPHPDILRFNLSAGYFRTCNSLIISVVHKPVWKMKPELPFLKNSRFHCLFSV